MVTQLSTPELEQASKQGTLSEPVERQATQAQQFGALVLVPKIWSLIGRAIQKNTYLGEKRLEIPTMRAAGSYQSSVPVGIPPVDLPEHVELLGTVLMYSESRINRKVS